MTTPDLFSAPLTPAHPEPEEAMRIIIVWASSEAALAVPPQVWMALEVLAWLAESAVLSGVKRRIG